MHASVIPVGGTNRGKVLIWDKSQALNCSHQTMPGVYNGDRDQRWAIIDPELQTVTYGSFTIQAQYAPPVYRTIPGINITHGAQGLFCAGHLWLPDGKLLTVGGDDWLANLAQQAAFTGSPLACIYDPATGTNGTWSTVPEAFTGVPHLAEARWYPSAVLAWDPSQSGRAVKISVLGGIEEFRPSDPGSNGIIIPSDRAYLTHEAYDYVQSPATGIWTLTKDTRQGGTLPSGYAPNQALPQGLFLGPTTTSSITADYPLGMSLFYYSRAHYLSDTVLGGGNTNGLIWSAGMTVDATWMDHVIAPNSWPSPHPILTASWPMLEEPTGVLLPALIGGGNENRIALIGGEYGMLHQGPISGDVHMLDANTAGPIWSSVAIPPLHHPRKFANATLLPDRSVLVTGGGKNSGHGQPGNEVFIPEVLIGGAWYECAPEASPRTYHSGAVLLPSARVATMGGDSSTYDVQVFEPHYFQIPGPRPVITTSPALITYFANNSANDFSIPYTTDSGRTVQSACLISPISLTHGHDGNQRLVDLPIIGQSGGQLTLRTPLNPSKAPYGWYMLFLHDSAGAVSEARWVQLL